MDDAEMLNSRHVPWANVPSDSRERVVPYLSVRDCLTLDVALTTKTDRLREELTRAFQTAELPAFNTYPFTDKDDFKGLRWVMRAGVKLHSVTLSLNAISATGGAAVKDVDDVLWHLVKRKIPDIAGLYAEKSKAKDVTRRAAGNLESTLWLAAESGYAPVVRVLIKKGADIDKRYDWRSPLYKASFCGHVDVVKVLLEAGADIDKATDRGDTSLCVASWGGHVDVVKMLLETGADINIISNRFTALTINTQCLPTPHSPS